jgi:hypothetical protein
LGVFDVTVFFMGTELEDFANRGGALNHATPASYRKAANTRVAILVNTAAEDTNYIETDAFSSSDNFWTHVVQGYGLLTGTQYMYKWYSGGVQKLGVRFNPSTTGTIEVAKWTGAAWSLLASVTDNLYIPSNSVVSTFDCYIKLGNPGEFRLYWNNLPAISRNDLDLSGIGTIDKVRFNPPGSSSNHDSYVSEIIVADFNTIGAKIVSRPPTGNGSYQEWTNGAFGIVDDTSATGADLAVSGTVGQRTTYTHAAFTALAGTETLAAVKVSAAVNRDAAGPQNINFMTRIGSTDYNGADTALNVTQTRIGKMWETSPATAVAWTIAELNAAAMGVRSRT